MTARQVQSFFGVLIVAYFVLSTGSIFATTVAGPTSRELLTQGRKVLEAGKLAEAELILEIGRAHV